MTSRMARSTDSFAENGQGRPGGLGGMHPEPFGFQAVDYEFEDVESSSVTSTVV